ncbi:MAG: NUDIX domain-containing protein [Myxococcales bacterium]|nr:NUDIX domain-containing protein [Myxococcales bacterium]
MAREGIPTWTYALVVVRLGRRFLLVQESHHGQKWYLPAGRVEPGEGIAEAAIRETLEESGLSVVLEGLLRVEHSVSPLGARVRVFFVARPADDSAPKEVADLHSLQAKWVGLDELDHLPLRSSEVKSVLDYVSRGGQVFPLSMLSPEGAPWRGPAG